jgi:hypothetical protein
MKVDLNSGLEGLHGKADGYVYRKYRGKQIRQKKPTFSGEWGAGTVKQRACFESASKWYEEVVKPDPVLVALYRNKGYKRKLNFRQMAMGDYFNPPRVGGIFWHESVPGQPRKAWLDVRDDFEVVRVVVMLRDADGKLCHETDADRVKDRFYVTLPPETEGAKPPASIEVTAYDRPGNKATRTFELVLTQNAAATPPSETVTVAPTPEPSHFVEGHAVY